MNEPENTQDAPAEVMRVAAVAQALGVSRSTVWAWTKAGKFPKPRKLGDKLTVWPRREVMEYIASLPYASDDAEVEDVQET